MVLREVPISEITLRKYERPGDLKKRDLVKKLCLSLGLLQPGDSRDVIVDILFVMFSFGDALSTEQIRELVVAYRQENGLQMNGVATSNIRRQLKRLRGMLIVEKVKNFYRIREGLSMSEVFESGVKRYLLESVSARINEYCVKVDEEFRKERK